MSNSTITTKRRVILGLMTFGPPGTESHGARITSVDTFRACLTHLQSNGYSELDTARVYINGAQERFTREAGYRDLGFSIATKVFPEQPGMHEPARVKELFDTSLKELGASRVDIFYLHAPDRSVPFEDTLRACDELYREGKFEKLGLSNYMAWEVAEIIGIARQRGWVCPSVYQAMYNALTRAIEPELVSCCRKFGIDIVIYNPLAGGIFSGKYSGSNIPTEGRYSNTDSAEGVMYRQRYFQSATFEALKLVEPVVKKQGLTLVETALRWCVHHSILKIGGSIRSGEVPGNNDGIIIGVSSLQQLEGNLRDLEKGPLPSEVVEVLDRAWNITKGTCPAYWR